MRVGINRNKRGWSKDTSYPIRNSLKVISLFGCGIIMKETQGIFPQEFFDALFVEALGDLRKSGFKEKEVFSIIKDQFGVKYARQFCGQEKQKGESDK